MTKDAAHMNRYLLFAYEGNEPLGGWSDFMGAFDSLQDAVAVGEFKGREPGSWFQVVDTATLEVISEG